MATLIDEIVIKLHHLPESRLRKVLSFVDALSESDQSSKTTDASEEPLLQIAGMLSGEPLAPEDIDTELYGKSPL
jgi:hypothetical protein